MSQITKVQCRAAACRFKFVYDGPTGQTVCCPKCRASTTYDYPIERDVAALPDSHVRDAIDSLLRTQTPAAARTMLEDILKAGKRADPPNCTRCGYPGANSSHDECCPDGEAHQYPAAVPNREEDNSKSTQQAAVFANISAALAAKLPKLGDRRYTRESYLTITIYSLRERLESAWDAVEALRDYIGKFVAQLGMARRQAEQPEQPGDSMLPLAHDSVSFWLLMQTHYERRLLELGLDGDKLIDWSKKLDELLHDLPKRP